jgi:hypothetical protein
MEFPKCCGEPMEPIFTYRSTDGHLYRTFHCNNKACTARDREVQIT